MKEDPKELQEFLYERGDLLPEDILGSSSRTVDIFAAVPEFEERAVHEDDIFASVSKRGEVAEREDDIFTRLSGSKPGVADELGVLPEEPTEADIWEEPEVEEIEETGLELEEMIDDPVRMYLREMGRVSLLSAREEKILARKKIKLKLKQMPIIYYVKLRIIYYG